MRTRSRPPRHEPPALIGRRGTRSFVVWLLSGMLWLILLQSTYDYGFGDVVRGFGLPLLLAALFYLHRYWPWLRAQAPGKSAGHLLAAATTTCLVVLLMIWPHLMLLNALGPTQPLRYEGTLERKWLVRGKGRSYVMAFIDRASNTEVSVVIDRPLFDSLSERDTVRCDFRRGWLGIPYRWRYGAADTRCRRLESP